MATEAEDFDGRVRRATAIAQGWRRNLDAQTEQIALKAYREWEEKQAMTAVKRPELYGIWEGRYWITDGKHHVLTSQDRRDMLAYVVNLKADRVAALAVYDDGYHPEFSVRAIGDDGQPKEEMANDGN